MNKLRKPQNVQSMLSNPQGVTKKYTPPLPAKGKIAKKKLQAFKKMNNG